MKIDQDSIKISLIIFLRELKEYGLDVLDNIVMFFKILLGFAVAILLCAIWIKLAILANKTDNNWLFALAIGYPILLVIFIFPLAFRMIK